jgi:hypothetical protein
LTKRVIEISWAVEPLAFSVGLPPQGTDDTVADGISDDIVAGKVPDGELPRGAVVPPPHADDSTAAMVNIFSVTPKRLRFNSIPCGQTDEAEDLRHR